MSKKFDTIMAGVIAGIVVITTYAFGIAGTAIGAVLGSMLFQVLSHYIKDPLEDAKVHHIEREFVFVFPLIFIVMIEIIFALLLVSIQFHNSPLDYFFLSNIFNTLELATGNNLFRILGISLLIMGIYPIIQPNVIKKSYGIIISSLGLILLLRGLIDINSSFTSFYAFLFHEFDLGFAVLIAIILIIISLLILKDSLTILKDKTVRKDDIEIIERVNIREKEDRIAKYEESNIKTTKGCHFHQHKEIKLDDTKDNHSNNPPRDNPNNNPTTPNNDSDKGNIDIGNNGGSDNR